MKVLVYSFFIWASVASFLSPSYALVQDSPHELSNPDFKASGLCITCHLPEDSVSQTKIPLWNPAGANQTFISYNTAGLAIDMSQKCISCHDGLNGIDRFGNLIGSTNLNANTFAVRNTLHNNHPVSIPYTVKVGKFRDIIGSTEVKLFNGKVECVTCHHPHLAHNKKHLRSSNTKSSLCLTCHDK